MRALRTGSGLVLCATLLAGTAACSGSGAVAGPATRDGGLDLVRRESLTSVAVPGTEQGSVIETKGRTAVGKPSSPQVLRMLPLAAGTTPQDAVASAAELARADGWTSDPQPPAPEEAWLWHKSAGTDELELALYVIDAAGRRQLVVVTTDLTG